MKADIIYNDAVERLTTCAKSLLMDIISRRIDKGEMEEEKDGCYEIDNEIPTLNVDVWVNDTYTDEDYMEKREVVGFGLDEFPYVIFEDEDEVIANLSVRDMVKVCNALEEMNENESK